MIHTMTPFRPRFHRSYPAPVRESWPAARACRSLALAGWLAAGGAAAVQPDPVGTQAPQGIEQILQSAPKGKLTVSAVLVSGGSTSPVPGAVAEVHLFHNNRPFKQFKVLLDEHGVTVLELSLIHI